MKRLANEEDMYRFMFRFFGSHEIRSIRVSADTDHSVIMSIKLTKPKAKEKRVVKHENK